MNPDIILSCENLSLTYKTRSGFLSTFTHHALQDISLKIHKGEVFGILGGNGSGKSSLLKILAGVLPPTTGKVFVKGGTTRALLALGLGFNNDLSGKDNTILSAMLNGFSLSQAKSITQKVKVFSELGKFYEQPVRTYSAGMRSKLGFATALFCDVDILFIDETLSVGDHNFKQKAEDALMDIINHKDKTVLFVSHSKQQIQRLCHRCAWIVDGKIHAIGQTEDIIRIYR